MLTCSCTVHTDLIIISLGVFTKCWTESSISSRFSFLKNGDFCFSSLVISLGHTFIGIEFALTSPFTFSWVCIGVFHLRDIHYVRYLNRLLQLQFKQQSICPHTVVLICTAVIALNIYVFEIKQNKLKWKQWKRKTHWSLYIRFKFVVFFRLIVIQL